MKYCLSLIAFVAASVTALAGPQQQWSVVTSNPSGDDLPAAYNKNILIDSSGDSYYVGSVDGAIGSSAGSWPVIRKISGVTGGAIWSCVIPNLSAAYSRFDAVKWDALGNLYVVGRLGGGVSGFTECLVVKLTPAGAMSPDWPDIGYGVGVRRIGNGLTNFYGESIEVIGGGVVVSGWADTHLFVAKLDSGGSFEPGWADLGDGVGRRYLYPLGVGGAIRGHMGTDSVGNIYVGGALSNLFTGQDIVVVKYSSSGVKLWTSFYSVNTTDNTSDYLNDFYVDSSGDSYATGSSPTAAGQPRMVVVKWNAAGVRQYAHRGTADGYGLCVRADGAGVVYACGRATSASRGVIWKLNAAGMSSGSWADTGAGVGRRYFGPFDSEANALIISGSNELYVVGREYPSVSSTGGPAASRVNLNNGNRIWFDVDYTYSSGTIYSVGGGLSSFVLGFGHTEELFSPNQTDEWKSRYIP